MRMIKKIRDRISALTIRERLICSNILMFLIPVAVTAVTAAGALGIAFFAFRQFYLPRLGLSARDLHEMGEQYEGDLRSFLLLCTVLGVVTLALLIVAILLTNRFLTRFMFRRVEQPLALLNEGVERVSRGELDGTVSYDRTDEFAPVIRAFNDMTERLKDSAERTSAEEQSRRELFAGISHDLRSPLTSVRAYTEALLDGVAKSPEDTRRYLKKIRLHESEIERLTDALFLYTKMGLRDYPVHTGALNLREELSRICTQNPTDPHLQIVYGTVKAFRVIADPFLLERILQNLFNNSRKYRRGETAHVTVSAEQADGGVLLSVADDGTGVPEALLPRLFDPFYRTDPARGNPAGGSGLGLAIVRRATEQMGGQVRAENLPGGGLCIRILFKEASEHGSHPDY